MNISNVSSTTNPRQTVAFGGFGQRMQDFRGLANALQAGDISSAQNASTTLVNNLQNSQGNWKTSQLLDQNTQAGKDFQALQVALASGDIKAAQDAFKTFKTDLHSVRRAHHHHRAANDGDTVEGGSNLAPTTTISAPPVSASAPPVSAPTGVSESTPSASVEQIPSTLDALA
jgi:hypothetical protein